MLPFGYRTNKLKGIEFRNVCAPNGDLAHFQIEVETCKPTYLDGSEPEVEVISSKDLHLCALNPCFHFNEENEDQEFIQKFEKINSMQMMFRLKTEGGTPYEFKVDWNNLVYLCKDLADIQPFNIPIIVFAFEHIVAGDTQNKEVKEAEPQRRSTRKKRSKNFIYPLYFTTKEIWD